MDENLGRSGSFRAAMSIFGESINGRKADKNRGTVPAQEVVSEFTRFSDSCEQTSSSTVLNFIVFLYDFCKNALYLYLYIHFGVYMCRICLLK